MKEVSNARIPTFCLLGVSKWKRMLALEPEDISYGEDRVEKWSTVVF